jgi:D-serine deaminase-like pyridoxal phosphate-dependent protein
MTQQQTVMVVFENAGTAKEVRHSEVVTATGFADNVVAVMLSKLRARGAIVRLRRGAYRLATGPEQLEHAARASQTAATTPRPAVKLDQQAERIRAEERDKLLVRVREAAATGICRESRDWIDGFEAGVQHVVSTILGDENGTHVRRTG